MAEINTLRRVFEDDTASEDAAMAPAPDDLGPLSSWSDDLVVLAAGQGRPEAIAERARRTDSLLGKSRATTPAPDVRASAKTPALAPAPRAPVAVSPRKPTAREAVITGPTPSYTLEEIRDPAVYAPENMLSPLSKEQTATPLPPEQLAAETARAQKLMAEEDAKYAAKPSAIAPVPTAAGPSPTAAAPSATVTKALTTPPPPPAAPVAGAGGDADLDRLALGQSLIQGLETFGSAVSGKNLRSGMAESLGERYRQAQALQAKRAEKVEAESKAARFGSRLSTLFPGLTPEQQKTLEQTIAEGGIEAGINVAKMFKGAQTDKEVQRQVNEAAITSAVARYPELATSFEALRPVAGEYPQKDFATMLDKAAAGQAGFAAKGAATRFMVDKQGRFNQLTPIEVEQEKLRNDALRQQADLNAREFTLKEKTALEAPGKTEQEFKEKLVTLGDKEKGFGGYVNLAKDLAEVEAAAPGFVTQGRPPEWLTTESLATAQKFPRSADPRVVRFLAKYANLANTKRHQLYGSAQTEGELRAFLQQLSDDPFFAGPEVIATQMQAFGESAARTATSTLNRYGKAFSPTSVATVFGDEFKPLYEKGGVFAGLGQKSPFVAPAAPVAASASGILAPTAGGVERVIMIDKEGKRQAVRADQVERAKAERGWRMP